MKTEKVKPNKSRNLSPASYYSILQQEYLQAEFRRKIYYNVADKNYYERVMGHKKDKIIGLQKNNGLPSIFDSDEVMREIRNLCFRDGNGFPLFPLNNLDLCNYFLPNNDFRYKDKVVSLVDFNLDTMVAKIKYPNETQVFLVSPRDIVRIL